jgi:pSer/pThr/pTyr-binding forkhead associated (FHA) protein
MAVGLEWVKTGQAFPLPLGRPAGIGRGQQAEIVLGDSHVSRQHCQALWDGCRVWVQDLGSRCGTYLNGERPRDGERVAEPEGGLLRLGDVLHVGPVWLRLGTPSRVETAWLAWHGGRIVSMVAHLFEAGDFGDLPVLADALEEAGCADTDILAHCRAGGGHVRGCWVLDLLLGKG